MVPVAELYLASAYALSAAGEARAASGSAVAVVERSESFRVGMKGFVGGGLQVFGP